MRWWRIVEQGVVDAILLAVGGIATYLSVKYTWQWQTYTGDQVVEGLAYAVVIVGFSTLIFEFAVQAQREKKKWAWALFLAWLVVASYSMQTTVAGQWIGVREREAERASETSEVATAQYTESALAKKGELLQERLSQVRERSAQVRQLLAGVDSVEKRQEFRRNSAELEKELKELNASEEKITESLMAVELERASLMGKARVAQVTGAGSSVFAFYEEVLGIKAQKVEFALAVFKGIILDTVNILCFMFVMLRRSKKGESSVELQPVQEEGPPQMRGKTRAQSPCEALTEEAYRPGRRGRFPGVRWATDNDLQAYEFKTVVSALVKRGTLVQRKGRIWLNPHVGKEEFLCELKELGLTPRS